MKRLILFLLAISFALSCTACAGTEEDHPSFYYLRTEDTIAYGKEDALIAPVAQEFSENIQPDQVWQLYFSGPGKEGYRSPFPRGTGLQGLTQKENLLILELSPEFSELDGIRLTLAGACLAATCRELTGMERIQVRSGSQIYDFYYHDFTFLDNSTGK